jgi:hypothetical protein
VWEIVLSKRSRIYCENTLLLFILSD